MFLSSCPTLRFRGVRAVTCRVKAVVTSIFSVEPFISIPLKAAAGCAPWAECSLLCELVIGGDGTPNCVNEHLGLHQPCPAGCGICVCSSPLNTERSSRL